MATQQERTAEILTFYDGTIVVSLYPANGAWSIADMYDDEIAAGLPTREAAIARATEWANARRVECECGRVTGERCKWCGPLGQTVEVEHMPAQHRASHRAAGNRGTYPHNGAIRARVAREHAVFLVQGDPEWTTRVE